ncbi:hypothetical protein QL093DRAFT_2123410 [Fusarium oxysporum]|nr:hypothetical protein QL093DRAFT_2123410 [Fusarium oxysporum]
MRNSNRRVLSWLDSVPNDLLSTDTHSTSQEHAQSRNRPGAGSRTHLSSPTSQNSWAQDASLETNSVSKMQPATPSKKRRRLIRDSASGAHAPHDDDNENDETPTQPNRGTAPSLRESDTSSLSYQSSHASHNSSPSKMFSSLGLYPTGVDRKILNLDNPDVPDALAELCIEMDTIATGSRVVPGYLEPEISQLKTTNRAFSLFRPGVFDSLVNESIASESAPGAASLAISGVHHELTLNEVMQLVGDADYCGDVLEIRSVRRPRRWQGVEEGGTFYKRSCLYINSGSPAALLG